MEILSIHFAVRALETRLLGVPFAAEWELFGYEVVQYRQWQRETKPGILQKLKFKCRQSADKIDEHLRARDRATRCIFGRRCHNIATILAH